MTPLHWAVVKRHKKIADSLLKQGADPSAISKFFKTPLSIAAESNQTDVLQELLAWKMRIGDPEQQSATDALINEMNMTVAQPTLDAQVFDDDDVQLPNGVEHKFMPSLSSMGSSSPGQMYSNVAPSHREINGEWQLRCVPQFMPYRVELGWLSNTNIEKYRLFFRKFSSSSFEGSFTDLKKCSPQIKSHRIKNRVALEYCIVLV